MIIRKKISQKKEKSSLKQSSLAKGNIIKKEDLIDNAPKETQQENITAQQEKKEAKEPESFEKIDISSIDFKERVERRRGDRRRGYRRIDERSLVSRAQAEAYTIKELAAREGYQNGLKKAQKEIDEIKTSLSEFLSMKDEMYSEFYPHIMEISLEIAKKIIKKEVETDKNILKEVIMSTLGEINPDVQKITIKVNSEDLEFASASLPEIAEAKKISVRIDIMPDDTIEKGSCIVIANNGVIDANFKTQLAVLQNAFGIYKGGL